MRSKRNGHAPFWRKSKKCWYVHHGGRMLALGRDKDAAWAKWHELQAQPAAVADPAGKCKTVADLATAFEARAEVYYRKDGQPTSEVWVVADALRRFRKVCGSAPLGELSPVHIEKFQELLVDEGLARTTVNGYCARVRRMVRWGVAKRHIPENIRGTILAEIDAVEPVKKGRALGLRCREPKPVKPVPQARIDALKPHVSATTWGLIQFQLLTGARPGEALALRACDLNTQGEIWEYRPASHKTEHHDKDRVVMIGKRAQALLQQFPMTDLQAPVFPGYRRDSYRNAIVRGCELAFEMPKELRIIKTKDPAERERLKKLARDWRAENCWHPNQLRHNFGTLARREFGIEASRVTLGHSSVNTSEIYAERDLDAARDVVRRIG